METRIPSTKRDDNDNHSANDMDNLPYMTNAYDDDIDNGDENSKVYDAV